MIFNSWEFLLFFVVVFALYASVKLRWQNILLVVASYFFYGWWDWRFLSLLLLSTVVDYTVGRLLEHAQDEGRRKTLLLVSVFTNLGILGFFKYCNFFVDSAVGALTSMGLEAHAPTLQIVLPVGISFYTFQTMAYTIDVYRRRMEVVKDPVAFAVYVSYFPQLVAGPIERAQHLLPQFEKKRTITLEKFSSGALLVLIGLVRKVVIADVAAGEVDAAFSDPGGLGSWALLRAVFLFGLQIYGDFAGYTDIARGVSRMLGIELMRNFEHPYFSTNITIFWRRWHVSLSSWLRDYLYIPLGGNRGPEWFVYRNLLLTMLLGGLWHGAAWTFVVWGAIHGGALSVHKLLLRGKRPPLWPAMPRSVGGALKMAGSWVLTMIVVYVAWVFFRASSFGNAFDVLSGIFAFEGGFSVRSLAMPVLLTALVLFLDVPQYLSRKHIVMRSWPWPVRGLVYAALILILAIFRSESDVPFIYFQF
jgi:alginate O-acetyltransferase complex protein AlgI